MSSLRDVKVIALNYKYSIQKRLHPDAIQVVHYQMRNWGDSINPIFASCLTGKKVISVDIEAMKRYPANYPDTMYLGIGSIIHHANRNTVIWGSGLQEPLRLREKPMKICAVRGPMTRQALLDQGLECPEIYGDPALLLPRIYSPEDRPKSYKLGVASHIKDVRSPLFDKYRNDPSVKFISMRAHGLGLIDEFLECENIISTSLHGLVIADAYQIPTLWIKVSNLIPGNDFKFHDYHASINSNISSAAELDGSQTVSELADRCERRKLDIDLDNLLAHCPYRSKSNGI